MFKNQTKEDDLKLILKLDNGKTKSLEGYRLPFIPQKGDILQWNGIRYHIEKVIFHQKEGLAPYIELKSDYNEDFITGDINSLYYAMFTIIGQHLEEIKEALCKNDKNSAKEILTTVISQLEKIRESLLEEETE